MVRNAGRRSQGRTGLLYNSDLDPWNVAPWSVVLASRQLSDAAGGRRQSRSSRRRGRRARQALAVHDAEESWRPAGGESTAVIGPLVVDPGVSYTAHYLEAVIAPDFHQGERVGHRHPGPEAWFMVSGAQCLETPNGVITARQGQSMIAPDGWPMAISSLGSDLRRTLVLVLHRSDEPYTMPVDAKADAPHAQWKPRGLCERQ